MSYLEQSSRYQQKRSDEDIKAISPFVDSQKVCSEMAHLWSKGLEGPCLS